MIHRLHPERTKIVGTPGMTTLPNHPGVNQGALMRVRPSGAGAPLGIRSIR
jgi:hypothetical protein